MKDNFIPLSFFTRNYAFNLIRRTLGIIPYSKTGFIGPFVEGEFDHYHYRYGFKFKASYVPLGPIWRAHFYYGVKLKNPPHIPYYFLGSLKLSTHKDCWLEEGWFIKKIEYTGDVEKTIRKTETEIIPFLASHFKELIQLSTEIDGGKKTFVEDIELRKKPALLRWRRILIFLIILIGFWFILMQWGPH